MTKAAQVYMQGGGGGGGTLPYGLYGDVPLDRVWFFNPRNSMK